MAYDLRVDNRSIGVFETSEAALAKARELILADPDADPDILDTATGRAFEPAASKRWRDELSHKIGF